MEEKIIEFEFSTELIKKMLQGLEVQFVSDGVKVILYPPQRGIFLTHEEIKRLKIVARGLEKGYHLENELEDILRNKFSR